MKKFNENFTRLFLFFVRKLHLNKYIFQGIVCNCIDLNANKYNLIPFYVIEMNSTLLKSIIADHEKNSKDTYIYIYNYKGELISYGLYINVGCRLANQKEILIILNNHILNDCYKYISRAELALNDYRFYLHISEKDILNDTLKNKISFL